jgi:NADP-dependent 3-hydroxy acid dehydrogenase YdfG
MINENTNKVAVVTGGSRGIGTDMAQEAKTPFSDSDMIRPSDILQTIRWLLRLAPSTCIREIIIECKKAIH